MIQFKRGKSEKWQVHTQLLEDGQPGYDRDKHKLKIGDGINDWKNLPYVSGIFEKEAFSSEEEAKKRFEQEVDPIAIITYGTEAPDENVKGQLYVQYYESESPKDWIVYQGIDKGWRYRKWQSGIAECWGKFSKAGTLTEVFEDSSIYYNNIMDSLDYPFTFVELSDLKTPVETATLVSPGNLVWLAGRSSNSLSKSGSYTIMSPMAYADQAAYDIILAVRGYWK